VGKKEKKTFYMLFKLVQSGEAIGPNNEQNGALRNIRKV